MKSTKKNRTKITHEHPQLPHNCMYLLSLWSTFIRGINSLQKLREQQENCHPRDINEAIILLFHIIEPIYQQYPSFMAEEDSEIYQWAKNWTDMFGT